MSERSIFANLIRQPDGTCGAAFGPFLLQSAFQPLFSQDADGLLRIEAFEGFIRASIDGRSCPPSAFLQHVPPEELAAVDSLCRSLHILNAGTLKRADAALIVTMQPGLAHTAQALRQETDRLKLAAREAGLAPARVAVKLREARGGGPELADRLAANIHAAGFAVAIDDYTGDDRDLDRLTRLRPQFVAFDSAWLAGFTQNSAGLALVRVVIGQFADQGIRAIVTGIETPEQIALARALGAPLMQGYLLARPELAPTGFDLRFPEPDAGTSERAAAAMEIQSAKELPRFGRRRA